jgi:hypothetical protein
MLIEDRDTQLPHVIALWDAIGIVHGRTTPAG